MARFGGPGFYYLRLLIKKTQGQSKDHFMDLPSSGHMSIAQFGSLLLVPVSSMEISDFSMHRVLDVTRGSGSIGMVIVDVISHSPRSTGIPSANAFRKAVRDSGSP
jgi:hypothetical protein